jgi:hypothetical protein
MLGLETERTTYTALAKRHGAPLDANGRTRPIPVFDAVLGIFLKTDFGAIESPHSPVAGAIAES